MLLNITVTRSFGKLTKRLHSAFNIKSASLVDSSDVNTFYFYLADADCSTQQINWVMFAFSQVTG